MADPAGGVRLPQGLVPTARLTTTGQALGTKGALKEITHSHAAHFTMDSRDQSCSLSPEHTAVGAARGTPRPQAGGRSISLPPGFEQAGALLRTPSPPAHIVSETPDPRGCCPLVLTESEDAQLHLTPQPPSSTG